MRPGPVLPLASLALGAAPASPADAQSADVSAAGTVVAASGRIGPIYGHTLFIGRSTASDVRRAEGRKPTTNAPVMGRRGVVGRVLSYRIGKGRSACTRSYGFSTSSSRLGEFRSTCRDTRTATGTRFGMTPRQAEEHQLALAAYSPGLGHSCTFAAVGIATHLGNTWLVVWMSMTTSNRNQPDMVRSIAIYGPDAVIWSAACE